MDYTESIKADSVQQHNRSIPEYMSFTGQSFDPPEGTTFECYSKDMDKFEKGANLMLGFAHLTEALNRLAHTSDFHDHENVQAALEKGLWNAREWWDWTPFDVCIFIIENSNSYHAGLQTTFVEVCRKQLKVVGPHWTVFKDETTLDSLSLQQNDSQSRTDSMSQDMEQDDSDDECSEMSLYWKFIRKKYSKLYKERETWTCTRVLVNRIDKWKLWDEWAQDCSEHAVLAGPDVDTGRTLKCLSLLSQIIETHFAGTLPPEEFKDLWCDVSRLGYPNNHNGEPMFLAVCGADISMIKNLITCDMSTSLAYNPPQKAQTVPKATQNNDQKDNDPNTGNAPKRIRTASAAKKANAVKAKNLFPAETMNCTVTLVGGTGAKQRHVNWAEDIFKTRNAALMNVEEPKYLSIPIRDARLVSLNWACQWGKHLLTPKSKLPEIKWHGEVLKKSWVQVRKTTKLQIAGAHRAEIFAEGADEAHDAIMAELKSDDCRMDLDELLEDPRVSLMAKSFLTSHSNWKSDLASTPVARVAATNLIDSQPVSANAVQVAFGKCFDGFEAMFDFQCRQLISLTSQHVKKTSSIPKACGMLKSVEDLTWCSGFRAKAIIHVLKQHKDTQQIASSDVLGQLDLYEAEIMLLDAASGSDKSSWMKLWVCN